ncbi:hypothetical protein L211DRAFT_674466 [Terfezia boudieri ATCC MYA-4762]|uniref:CFEM domain-containing protein n=1 Tax=Terfezia boudieri ATCC MYA-4762 TaxID=1051890 RepID=A0A3N4LDY0_9PEZI|nr:hypothetical protein L211DRAFT_674466 [Terfezia boudieri ATCC MYA-4762]
MKSAIFAAVVALAVPAVYAQVPQLDPCAQSCFFVIENPDVNCADSKCLCSSPLILQSIVMCIQKECDERGGKSVLSAVQEFCQPVE